MYNICMSSIEDHASNLRVPAELRAQFGRMAARLSRAGVEVQWSKVALTAMRKGSVALAQELDPPDEREPPPVAA